MTSLDIIREELKDIRYYYSRKSVFDSVLSSVGENAILKTIEKYNDAIKLAPPRLYDLYVSLYLQNNTQESLSDKLGYTFETISRLHSKLLRFLKEQFDKKEDK